MEAMNKSPLLLPEEFNAATYFVDRHISEGRSERVAIECGDRCVTYRQLFESVNRVGNALKKLDVRPEERVFLLLLDTPEFAASFFGAIKIGAVPVPVNTLLKPADYEFLLNNCRARVVIASDSLFPYLQNIPRERLPYVETFIIVGNGAERPGTLSFDSWIHESPITLDAARTSKDDVAFWLYSSGSTGKPKACVHLQHDMVVCYERYAKPILGIREGDRCFSVSKLFFAYGLGNALYYPLGAGATAILLSEPAKPAAIF